MKEQLEEYKKEEKDYAAKDIRAKIQTWAGLSLYTRRLLHQLNRSLSEAPAAWSMTILAQNPGFVLHAVLQ